MDLNGEEYSVGPHQATPSAAGERVVIGDVKTEPAGIPIKVSVSVPQLPPNRPDQPPPAVPQVSKRHIKPTNTDFFFKIKPSSSAILPEAKMDDGTEMEEADNDKIHGAGGVTSNNKADESSELSMGKIHIQPRFKLPNSLT